MKTSSTHIPDSAFQPRLDQAYFWTPEWQEKERRANDDAKYGRSNKYNNAEEAIAALNAPAG